MRRQGLGHSLNWQDAMLGCGSQMLEDAVVEPKALEIPRPTRPFPLLILVFCGWPLPPQRSFPSARG